MKLFGRTAGYYLFWTGAIYFAVGIYCIFVDSFIPVWTAQLIWIAMLLVPLVIPQVGRYFNMHTFWEMNMFGWRKRQIAEKVDADINETALPEPTVTPPMPGVVAPKVIPLDNEDAEYTVGINSAGNTQLRIRLQYGSATLTMSPVAVRQLIRQLEVTLKADESEEESK